MNLPALVDSYRTALLWMLSSAFLLGPLQEVAGADGTKTTKYGAWEFRCETPAGEASKQCFITQTMNAEDRDSNLAILIMKPKEAQQGLFRIIAPMSVFLPNGVNLKIDQTDIGRIGFFRCYPTGCLADAPVDDKLYEELKNGKTAMLVIYLNPYEGNRHLFKLDGFQEAYEKLGQSSN
jgi:invasion protein IalB